MTYLALLLFSDPDIPPMGMWVFLSIGAVSLFAIFLPAVVWLGKRGEEREAFYKAETLRRITEASGEGAKAAIELLREDDRLKRIKTREGLKLGGLICIAVGAALSLLLGSRHQAGFLVGLIPGFIGIALLVYVYFLSSPVE
jgi:hypothetical protein